MSIRLFHMFFVAIMLITGCEMGYSPLKSDLEVKINEKFGTDFAYLDQIHIYYWDEKTSKYQLIKMINEEQIREIVDALAGSVETKSVKSNDFQYKVVLSTSEENKEYNKKQSKTELFLFEEEDMLYIYHNGKYYQATLELMNALSRDDFADISFGMSKPEIASLTKDEHNSKSKSAKELNSVIGQLSLQELNYQSLLLQKEKGIDKKTADNEAFQTLLTHAALINKARELGIEVTDEEARKKALQVRSIIAENIAEGSNEAKAYISQLIEKLGITEEEYWTEFAINGYKQTMMIEKLQDTLKSDASDKSWDDFVQEIKNEYISNHQESIDEFKRNAGIK